MHRYNAIMLHTLLGRYVAGQNVAEPQFAQNVAEPLFAQNVAEPQFARMNAPPQWQPVHIAWA